MQPAFHHRQLEAYAGVMVEFATRMVESFVDGEVRNIGDEMAKLTLAVVVKSLFGADLPFDAGELGQSILAALDAANQRMNAALPVPLWAPTRRNLRLRRALPRQEAMLRILVEARRASGESRNDLLSALLAAVDEDSGARMSDQQLRDEMMTLWGRTRDHRHSIDVDVVPAVAASRGGGEAGGGARPGFGWTCAGAGGSGEIALYRDGLARDATPVSAGPYVWARAD